jgi:hypothetical protein
MALIGKGSLKAPKRKTRDVHVPGLGGEVRLRAMTAGEAMATRRAAEKIGADADAELSPGLIVDSWVDGTGKPMWAGDREAGIAFVHELSPQDFNALASAVLELNGAGAAALEEAEKN